MAYTANNLIDAIRNSNLVETRKMTASLIDVNALVDGRLPLVEAAGVGAPFVDALVSAGAEVNKRDGKGDTALLRACEKGAVEAVTALLAAGADANVSNGPVKNAIRMAVRTRSPRHLQVLDALVAAGADVNILSRSKFGQPTSTPLIEACRVGNAEAAEKLLSAGADANVIVANGTALTIAASEGQEHVVRLLLAAVAEPVLRLPSDTSVFKEVAGKTAVELAQMNGHARIAELLSSRQTNAHTPVRHSTNLAEAWGHLQRALAAGCPKSLETFAARACEADMVELAVVCGENIARAAEALFREFNGQSDDAGAAFIRAGDRFFSKFRFMQMSEVIREWLMWNELTAGGEFRGRRVLADAGVQAEWYHRGWLPLTSDGLGNSHCLDIAPAEGGNAGQVILLWHDQEFRPLIAKSLMEWLDAIANDIKISGE